MSFNEETIRAQFPILQRKVHDKEVVYLDSGATSQKPKFVIDKIQQFYAHYNSNVHRGIHTMAEESTAAFEGARVKVANFINAKDPRSLIFTSGTTGAINLVAESWGSQNLKEGDEILLTQMEHL